MKRLRQEIKKSKRRKHWVKDLFQARENKDAFQQTLQIYLSQIEKLISGIGLLKFKF